MTTLISVAAIVPLDAPDHRVRWHFVDASFINFTVIILMIVFFVVTVLFASPGPQHLIVQTDC